MTPGNNGASTPEDDDPFGYLYADGQANGAQPPSGGYGYPNSVSRVRAVGERQYGQPQYGGQSTVPQQQQPYGQPQGAYGQPNPHYAAPESLPGGAPVRQQPAPAGGGGGRGGGPNTKGLLIGAVAVVAAVVVGIAVAMSQGDTGDESKGGDQPTASASASPSPTPSESSTSEATEVELPTIDAKALRLGGTANIASDVPGAQSEGGVYVGNLNQVGNSVTWTVNGIPEEGAYTLFSRFSTVGEDQEMTLTVNGKPFGSKINYGNFTHTSDGDFSKGWTQTYTWPTLAKGTNTITVSCEQGDKCNVLLDQFWLKKGQVKG
ncbi:carbohydrate-binding protein [Streptomyces sp. bgisy153]|uniref:carbohydrate-binding protein n=1 Tax=Streptomyces sp. bgisy153 TaxID=3413793 RepID=UPI003D742516